VSFCSILTKMGICIKLSLFFHRACCYRTLFKNPTHALCFKIHITTQSLFKTLEYLRLLCHPTCFGHILDHLQGMFRVQCCFPPCCFVTILLGYVAVSSICVVVMCTSLLSVLLSTQQDRQQRGTLLGYVAVSSICVVVMSTSLLSVLLCTQQDRQQRGILLGYVAISSVLLSCVPL